MATSMEFWACPCRNPDCSRNIEWNRANYYKKTLPSATYSQVFPVANITTTPDEASLWVGSYGDEALTTNKKTMLDKFLNIFRSEPEKSFRKAEVIDDKGLLTVAGKDLLLNWLLKKEGKEFKKEIVDEILKKDEIK